MKDGKSNQPIGTISFSKKLSGKRSAGKLHAAFEVAGDGNGVAKLPRHYSTLLGVLTELKNRGIEEICLACVDGLTGFPEAIGSVYPKAKVQLCIVHMVRNSLRYVSWKDRKALSIDLKKIYTAKTLQEAEMALESFSGRWDFKYPSISQTWLKNWDNLTHFFAYPEDIRKAIYTTNTIESLNMCLRKIIKNKRSFPNDDSVFKILFLAIEKIAKKWTMPIKDWKSAMNRFIIEFGEVIC